MPRKKTKREWTTIKDAEDNRLLCGRSDTTIKLKLHLKGEKKGRNIGDIYLKKRELVVKRKRAKHLYMATMSYGFNHKLLEEGRKFDNVRLIDEFAEYKIPRKWILENGNFMFFKKSGFELQIFVTLNALDQFKREPKF